MVNWTDIHPGFRYYQQIWEEWKLTHQEAQEWISNGFTPGDYIAVYHWKNLAFTPQQAKSCREIGLKPDWDNNDAEFAAYLRHQNLQPTADLNLEQLREEFYTWEEQPKPAQEYLDVFYPKKAREKVTKLKINCKNLTGVLDLSNFVDLEELDCSENKLTSLNSDKCLKLKIINGGICNASGNQEVDEFISKSNV